MEPQIEEEWSRAFETIKSKHDLAYKTIEIAIRNEEQEQPEVAMVNYKLGISLIDEGLNVQVAVPDDASDLDKSWNDACKMIHKMKRTRGEVLQRLTTLGQKHNLSNLMDICDASDGAASVATDVGSPMRPRTYFELSEELRKIRVRDTKSIDVMELLFSCEGVKLFYISDTGSVTTSSEDSVLRIVCLAENVEKKLERTYFLQIIETPQAVDPSELQDVSNESITNDVSWVYPLYPGTSPCFRTDFGAYVFPDLQADQPGSAIGIVVPAGSDEIVLEIFESLLHGIVKQGLSSDPEQLLRTRRATADVVSRNLVKGAYCISNGLVKGSEKVGQFVTYSTPFIISKLGPAPNNAQPVSERVVNGVEIAKSTASAAASFTGYVAGKVGSATMALGKFLAPHIQRQGSKLLTSAAGYSPEEANETMVGVLNITSGAVEGFSTVYSGLEKSAEILGHSLSNNSVKIIQHKYGPAAGEVAAGAFDTVGNIIHVSQNVNYMTPKGLAKKAAKHTGKAIVSEFRPTLPDVKYVPAGSLFPDLSEFAKAAASNQ